MEVLYTVEADQIEESDLILIDGDEVEVRKILECSDINGVSLLGFNRATGMVEPYELPFDYRVDVLGA